MRGGERLVREAWRARSRAATSSPLYVVHRIDKETSGLLMIAKKRSALVALQEQMRARTVDKTYAALVIGAWPKRLKVIDQALLRTVDARGSFCPGPLMELIRAIKESEVGDTIAVWSADKGSKTDIPKWVEKAGHRLIVVEALDGFDRIVIEKVPGYTVRPANFEKVKSEFLAVFPAELRPKADQVFLSNDMKELKAKIAMFCNVDPGAVFTSPDVKTIYALPMLVNPETGRVHTQFNQAVAATGRLSSSDPNLQNIPVRTATGPNTRPGGSEQTGGLPWYRQTKENEVRREGRQEVVAPR